MKVTKEQLMKIYPFAKGRIDKFIGPLNQAMEEFKINRPEDIAAFLAQIGHESGQLRYVKELASGEAYDTGRKAIALGNTPEKDGDGQKYKGRGLIQITGKRNYRLCGIALDLDLVKHPELLEEPLNACRSAGWYWYNNHLSGRCYPTCTLTDFKDITRRINGGYNGLQDRINIWQRAKKVFGI